MNQSKFSASSSKLSYSLQKDWLDPALLLRRRCGCSDFDRNALPPGSIPPPLIKYSYTATFLALLGHSKFIGAVRASYLSGYVLRHTLLSYLELVLVLLRRGLVKVVATQPRSLCHMGCSVRSLVILTGGLSFSHRFKYNKDLLKIREARRNPTQQQQQQFVHEKIAASPQLPRPQETAAMRKMCHITTPWRHGNLVMVLRRNSSRPGTFNPWANDCQHRTRNVTAAFGPHQKRNEQAVWQRLARAHDGALRSPLRLKWKWACRAIRRAIERHLQN
ncbi:hypothetical protein C8R45DRAFT_941041 [Mycena sanguinolenta]|nr:hypothetical protein C8R45DRAFT_941041 [Mycena sanguinolenta]